LDELLAKLHHARPVLYRINAAARGLPDPPARGRSMGPLQVYVIYCGYKLKPPYARRAAPTGRTAAMSQQKTAYDAIPYPTVPFPETHPARLAAIAKLFGHDAPAPAGARVLELGCSMGGNLIAIAQIHPGTRCVGVDASSNQIAEGWKTVDALGLKNVQLKHVDILDIGDDFGEFDYIISHGVYSWVPPVVQDKMLEICRRNLARDGVAYISYNTYPGWHIRGIVRDMMFYRGLQFAEPKMQLAEAKALVEFVSQSAHGPDSPYRQLLQAELKQLGKMTDHYLHHEYLEEHNQPLYFHQFARKLAVNGLQFLGEADFAMMIATNFSAEVAKTLQKIGAHDIVQMEQYMDFVRCRYFRKSLLCHNGVRLNRTIDGAAVKGLLLACNAAPAGANPALAPGEKVTYQTSGGSRLTCKAPVTKLALQILQRQWPMPMTFDELFEQSRREAAAEGYPLDADDTGDFLAGELLTGMGAGVIEWRTDPPPFTAAIGEKPVTTALARLQAAQGYRATNLRGEMVTLDEIHRQTLRLLDGDKTLPALTEGLIASLKNGQMVLHREGDTATVTDESEMRGILAPALDKVLANLARQAFFLPQPG
jgi:methyltransferase-like protein/SAM-dependent methyltransferase